MRGVLLVLLTWITSVNTGGVVFLSPEEQRRLMVAKWTECHLNMNKTDANIAESTGNHCEGVWDNVMCWSDTPAGTTAYQPCPYYINRFDTSEFATRECLPNGKWYSPVHKEDGKGWTNFSACPSTQKKQEPKQHAGSGVAQIMMRHIVAYRLMYNIGYGISLVSLILAIVIMVAFKKLHCPRNYIHLNLFVSFVLRASMNMIRENFWVHGLGFPKDVEENENGTVIFKEGPHWECRLFFTLYQYILIASYMWIFVEAVYLHMLIFVSVFTDKLRIIWYMLFGWSLPLPFVLSWAISRAVIDNTLCWNTSTDSPGLTWINKTPVMVSVVLNFFFFINIVRLLFTKLSNNPCPDATRYRYKKLARSVLVLIPIFGVYYLIFTFPMDDLDDTSSFVMLFVEMFFNSYQGLIIAILLCFVNGEVRTEIKKAWVRHNLRRSSTVTRFTHVSTTHRRSSAARVTDANIVSKPLQNFKTTKSSTSLTDCEESTHFTNNSTVNTYSMVYNDKDKGKRETEQEKTATEESKKDDEMKLTINFVNIECQSSDGNCKNTTSLDIQTLKNGCPVTESKVINNNTSDSDFKVVDESTAFLSDEG